MTMNIQKTKYAEEKKELGVKYDDDKARFDFHTVAMQATGIPERTVVKPFNYKMLNKLAQGSAADILKFAEEKKYFELQ